MKTKYLMIAALLSLFAMAGCKKPEGTPPESPAPSSQPETPPPSQEAPPPADQATPPADQQTPPPDNSGQPPQQ